MKVVQLASKSPRRRELLAQIGVGYSMVNVDVPEVLEVGESPLDYVRRLALSKARAGVDAADLAVGPVMGADTIVCCDDEILEKPTDESDCRRMLGLLSGRSHHVVTAVALCDGEQEILDHSVSEVCFRSISATQIERYWHTGEPRDKAGAYAIQGLGAVFVSSIKGSYTGIVGLPIELVTTMLAEFDVPLWNSEIYE